MPVTAAVAVAVTVIAVVPDSVPEFAETERLTVGVDEPIIILCVGKVAAVAVVPTHLVASTIKANIADAEFVIDTEDVADDPLAKYPLAFVEVGKLRNPLVSAVG